MAEIEQVEYTPAALAFPVEEGLVQACRESFGATLRAVVLTGSLARNEGSYIHRDGQAILQSDVEAIVVLQDEAPLPSRAASHKLCELAKQKLAARGVCVEVSFSVVHGSYLRHLPPHIYSYELRSCGVVLFGETTILELIPNYSASDVSLEDAWRMLSNRLIEQMEPIADTPETAALKRYRSIKLCLDVASSLLVFFGRFEAGYRARLLRMEEVALTPAAQLHLLPIPMEKFLPLVRLCTLAKLEPEANAGPGEGFEKEVTDWAWKIWRWQLLRMTGCDAEFGAEKLLRVFSRRQGNKKLLRGWLYAVRRMGWLSSAIYWPKWFWLFASGLTPRHAIYLAAYRWREACCGKAVSDQKTGMKAVRELLPVKGAARVTSADRIATQVVWNYKEFTTETRS
jgi:hypothetical protein